MPLDAVLARRLAARGIEADRDHDAQRDALQPISELDFEATLWRSSSTLQAPPRREDLNLRPTGSPASPIQGDRDPSLALSPLSSARSLNGAGSGHDPMAPARAHARIAAWSRIPAGIAAVTCQTYEVSGRLDVLNARRVAEAVDSLPGEVRAELPQAA